MPRGLHRELTAADEAIIRRDYLTRPIKPIAKELGISFGRIMRLLDAWGLEIPKKIREKRKAIGRYKEGDEPVNKGKKQHEYMSAEALEKTKATRFKKGDLPSNTKFDGYQRVSADGYIEVRVKARKFVALHHLVWCKAHGEIPEGHCVAFIDGNKQNVELNNLELISMAENMLRNSRHGFEKEVIPSLILVSKIKKKIKSKQDGKKQIDRPE